MSFDVQIRAPYAEDVLVRVRDTDEAMDLVGRILPHAPISTKITLLDHGRPQVYWVKRKTGLRRTAVRR